MPRVLMVLAWSVTLITIEEPEIIEHLLKAALLQKIDERAAVFLMSERVGLKLTGGVLVVVELRVEVVAGGHDDDATGPNGALQLGDKRFELTLLHATHNENAAHDVIFVAWVAVSNDIVPDDVKTRKLAIIPVGPKPFQVGSILIDGSDGESFFRVAHTIGAFAAANIKHVSASAMADRFADKRVGNKGILEAVFLLECRGVHGINPPAYLQHQRRWERRTGRPGCSDEHASRVALLQLRFASSLPCLPSPACV